jgi:8-oxo-dGTP pyrophosphatase MutT (NUDIX family)
MYRLDAIARRLGALPNDEAVLPSDHPRAAVAAILREHSPDHPAELLFIRRAEHPQDPWSGHIAFPGGRLEAGDRSLLETAIRETREEVGIDLARADVLGRLPDLPAFTRTRRARLVVSPFVFGIRGDVTVVPNHEVAETLWVPMSLLASDEGRGTFTWRSGDEAMELPCIRLPPAQHVLWGMTYRMLETMLEVLATR